MIILKIFARPIDNWQNISIIITVQNDCTRRQNG